MQAGVPKERIVFGVEAGQKAVAARRRQKPILHVVCVYAYPEIFAAEKAPKLSLLKELEKRNRKVW